MFNKETRLSDRWSVRVCESNGWVSVSLASSLDEFCLLSAAPWGQTDVFCLMLLLKWTPFYPLNWELLQWTFSKDCLSPNPLDWVEKLNLLLYNFSLKWAKQLEKKTGEFWMLDYCMTDKHSNHNTSACRQGCLFRPSAPQGAVDGKIKLIGFFSIRNRRYGAFISPLAPALRLAKSLTQRFIPPPPSGTLTAWLSACWRPMRSLSATWPCRSTSPWSRRSASTTTSASCEWTTCSDSPTSWATRPWDWRMRTASSSRYAPRQAQPFVQRLLKNAPKCYLIRPQTRDCFGFK